MSNQNAVGHHHHNQAKMRFILEWRGGFWLLAIPWAYGMTWTSQDLGIQYGGGENGVAIADLNNDGANDILFAAGYPSNPRQPFALINVGKSTSANTFSFSDPVPISTRGSYTKVDIASLSSGRTVVLLAGGKCLQHQTGCLNDPAILLELEVSGCGYWPLETRCSSESSVKWTDPSVGNDLHALFSPELGDGIDPAIITAGDRGISVFPPRRGKYSTASITLNDRYQVFSSVTGIAAGYVGKNPGLVIGSVLASNGVLSKFVAMSDE